MNEAYTLQEIIPIPAQCKGWRKHDFIGIDAIKAPSLRQCRCFYCGKPLRSHPDHPKVIDADTRRNQSRQGHAVQLAFSDEKVTT